LVNTQTVFCSGCSNLYSFHSALGFPFLHIQANSCFCFLIIGILTHVRRYLFVCLCVCVFISLMINYVGQLFMYLLAVCIFSLENENLYPFPIFQLISLYSVVWVLYVFWILPSYQIYSFSLSQLPFNFVDGFISIQKLFILMESHLLVLVFVAFCVKSKKSSRWILRISPPSFF